VSLAVVNTSMKRVFAVVDRASRERRFACLIGEAHQLGDRFGVPRLDADAGDKVST